MKPGCMKSVFRKKLLEVFVKMAVVVVAIVLMIEGVR